MGLFHLRFTTNDFDFAIVNYPLLDEDCPRATYYGVYISQLIRLGPVPLLKVSIFVIERSQKNRIKQGYIFNKLQKTY